mgnify:CR=1 FL=1
MRVLEDMSVDELKRLLKRLRDEGEERRKRAYERRLHDKAMLVARVLGKRLSSSKHEFRRGDMTIYDDAHGGVGHVKVGDEKVLSWDLHGCTRPEHFAIVRFRPGPWEDELEALYAEAKRKKAEEERRKLIKEIRELAERWGIDVEELMSD